MVLTAFLTEVVRIFVEYSLGPIMDFGIKLHVNRKIIAEFRCQDEKIPVYSLSVDFFVFPTLLSAVKKYSF